MSRHYDKSLDNRLAAIEGHVRAVRQMLTEDKECEDILLQLSAIQGSLEKLGKIILKDHLNNCVQEAIQRGDTQVLERFNQVLDKYL